MCVLVFFALFHWRIILYCMQQELRCILTVGPHVLCVQMCMIYTVVCLAGWLLCSEAARLRCGTDLLSDLIFVCGDRGIYLGESLSIHLSFSK